MEATQTQDKKPDRHKNEELTVSVAKQWYEANYKPVVTTRAYYEDTTACMMKPKWDAAKESNRKRYEVVELPILTKHKRLMMDRETYRNWKPEAQFNFVRNTAKLVVLYDKKTQDTRSFFMIFVGSYKYLQKTRNMGKNSYLYREPDFDGKVLFYELNGTFINGWKYTNGKITGSIAPVMEEETDKPQSRVWVEDCYTDYDYEIEQVCEDDYYIEYGKFLTRYAMSIGKKTRTTGKKTTPLEEAILRIMTEMTTRRMMQKKKGKNNSKGVWNK